MFTEYDVKGRRAGKQLRNTITVMATDEGGMLGRLLTFQEHPYEGPTNYTCVVCMRSNVDLQDFETRALRVRAGGDALHRRSARLGMDERRQHPA